MPISPFTMSRKAISEIKRRCCYLTPRHCKCPGVREPYENKVVRSRVIQAWSGRPGHCGRSLRRRRIRDDLGRLLRRLFRAGPGFRARERPSPPHDARPVDGGRSEEHTSELQSQSNLVCRLLLEKKKKKTKKKMSMK